SANAMPRRVESVEAIDRLWPAEGAARLSACASGGYEATPAWFANFAGSCLGAGDRLALRRVADPAGGGSSGGNAAHGVAFPFHIRDERWAGLRVRTLASLTN